MVRLQHETSDQIVTSPFVVTLHLERTEEQLARATWDQIVTSPFVVTLHLECTVESQMLAISLNFVIPWKTAVVEKAATYR